MKKFPACALLAVVLLTSCKQQAAVVAVPDPALTPASPVAAASDPATVSPMAATPVYHEFKDFVVGCDNTASCTAIAAPKDVQNGLFLSLQRGAGPNGAIALQVADSSGDALKASELTVDLKPSHALSALPWNTDAQGSLVLNDLASIQQFVNTVEQAATLHKGSDKDNYLSLSGLAASLLFIDETQGRLDNVTALGKVGAQPSTVVPSAPPVPVLAARYMPVPKALSEADSTRLAQRVRGQVSDALKQANCDFQPGPESLGEADAAIALTATEVMVFITCNGGPYQSEVLAYRASSDGQGAPMRVSLPPVPFKIGNEAAITFDTLVGADYDPTTATLRYFNKGRGLGDCGDSVTWRFDGKDFLLASVSSLDRCAGAASDYWPVYWRTAM